MTTTDGQPPRHLHPVEPPYDPEYDQTPVDARPTANRPAELAVLATLIQHPELGDTLDAELAPDDFHWPTHARIWEAWHHLATTEGTPPDHVTLNGHLIRTRFTEGVRLLTDLVTLDTTPAHATRYATLVRDASRLRVVETIGAELRNLAATGRPDQIDAKLGEALQLLDETVTRFGPTTATHTGLKDLSWILTGTAPTQPPPVWVRRSDGTALFYAGKVNGVFGDPEHGKTWLAQIALVEALNAGGTAAMIDVDHNGQDATAARLLLLGARLEHIGDPTRFRYYEPEDGEELTAAVDEVTRLAPDVVLIDSLGEIFPMLGVKTNDGDEMTTALRRTCTRPANAGCCVITIDHLPKSIEARTTGFAIGTIAKKRMIRGSYIRAEARSQPAPGQVGRITLRIEKDTAGELRKSSGGGYAGTLVLDSTSEHITTWSIAREEAPKNDDGTFRPTALMQRVSIYIEDNDQCTFTDIKEAITAKDKWLREAIQILATEGFVSRFDGARRAKLHHSIAPYREAEDDHVHDQS